MTEVAAVMLAATGRAYPSAASSRVSSAITTMPPSADGDNSNSARSADTNSQGHSSPHSAMSPPAPTLAGFAPATAMKLLRDLRSDLAGEIGAVAVYDGMLAAHSLRQWVGLAPLPPALADFAHTHRESERGHLAFFRSLFAFHQRERERDREQRWAATHGHDHVSHKDADTIAAATPTSSGHVISHHNATQPHVFRKVFGLGAAGFVSLIERARERAVGAVWTAAGAVLGFAPTLLAGESGAYLTVHAVETFVEEHYHGHIDPLVATPGGNPCPALTRCLTQFCADEVMHAEDAADHYGVASMAQALQQRLTLARVWFAIVYHGSAAAASLAPYI